MKNKLQKILLISSITLLSASMIATIGAITYAGYQRTQIIKDSTTGSNLTIAGEGKRMSSYYLDLGIWGTIDNSGYNFYAMAFKNDDHSKFEWILGVSSGDNYRYTFDVVSYDKIVFCRMSSSNTPTTFAHSYRTDSGGYSTDLTSYLSFEENKVTYQITGWHGASFEAVGFWR